MTPAQAEKLQNNIYRKMAPTRKLKILGDFFVFGKKLDSFKQKHESRTARGAFAPDCKNLKQA